MDAITAFLRSSTPKTQSLFDTQIHILIILIAILLLTKTRTTQLMRSEFLLAIEYLKIAVFCVESRQQFTILLAGRDVETSNLSEISNFSQISICEFITRSQH